MNVFCVGFSRPKKMNPLSYLIMWTLKTNYSHTYLLFSIPSTGQLVVCHANIRGVNCLSYETFKQSNLVIDEIHVVPESRPSAVEYCVNHLGKPYSFTTLLAIMFNIKFGDGTKGFICSELIARALNLDLTNLDVVTPKAIREILETK